MSARFEIVRSDAEQPWHARFRAANGRIVWSTEQYARRGGAEGAIGSLASFGYWEGQAIAFVNGRNLEVRILDERATS